MIERDGQIIVDQISKDAQLLRERFNILSEISNPEISLFLNLKPQTIEEAFALIPSLKRLPREKAEDIIQKALDIYKNNYFTFK